MADKLDLIPDKRTKKLITWSVAILLGAIGSGVWELFLKDVLHYFGTLLLKCWALHFSAESLYKNIGIGKFDYYGLVPFVILSAFLIVFPWMMALQICRSLNSIKDKMSGKKSDVDNNTEKKIIWMVKYKNYVIAYSMIMALLSLIIYSSIFYRAIYREDAVTWVERSIDILAPYVGQDNAIKLRSEYRSVDNAQKFYSLENSLKEQATKHGVVLPEFKSIR